MSSTSSTSRRTRKSINKRNQTKALVPIKTVKWSSPVKLLVGMVLFIIAAWLFLRFQNIVGLLFFAIVLAYLLFPLVKWFRSWSHFSWRMSVSAVYLVFIIIILGLTTLSGLAVIEQSQSLIGFLDRSIQNFPAFLAHISSQPISIGPYQFTPNLADLNALSQNLLSMVQPVLGRAGSLLGTVLSGTASFFALFFFILIISYFILAESGGGSNQLIQLNIPGYNEDFARFGVYLIRHLECIPAGSTHHHLDNHPGLYGAVGLFEAAFLYWIGNISRPGAFHSICWSGNRMDELWAGCFLSGSYTFWFNSHWVCHPGSWLRLDHGLNPR